MIPCISDPSLYLKHHDGKRINMRGNYVDDGLNARLPNFDLLTEATLKRFECKQRIYDNFGFFDMNIQAMRQGELQLNQEHFCKSLSVIPATACTEAFRRARAQLAWSTHSKPELGYHINKSAQVMEKAFSADRIKALSKGIKRAIKHSQ